MTVRIPPPPCIAWPPGEGSRLARYSYGAREGHFVMAASKFFRESFARFSAAHLSSAGPCGYGGATDVPDRSPLPCRLGPGRFQIQEARNTSSAAAPASQ